MNYWIFSVTSQKLNDRTYSGEEIYKQRMMDQFWGIGEKTPNRNNLRVGDKIVFYLGLPLKVFGGVATISTPLFELSDQQKNELSHGLDIYYTALGVNLIDINIWTNPKPVEELLNELTFIENKAYWFSYFQGGVRQISEKDYLIVTGQINVSLIKRIENTKDLESQAEFALEAHLEEFIYQNWSNIDWEAPLSLFQVDNLEGRQFPAGTWSIDFLAIDSTNNDLVIIELKRGKSSDATVGQILRYMNWVSENVAEEGQNVRGIIITKEIDEALKYAVKSLLNVNIKTYIVDFRLRSVT
jgi:small nuclear ribonucleoprotein (snRNP)-like protein